MVRLKSLKASLALCLIMLIAAAGGYLMPAERYKVAEILKLLLVGVLAWYAVSRGDYISRKTAMTGLRGEGWIINNLLEFLLLSLSVVIAFLTIHDFGPLLVTLLFLCAYMWLLMGTGKLLAVLSVWTGGIALALSLRGLLTQLAGVAYLFRRFDEMAEPFRQGTGEIAKLHWLRSSAGLLGHDWGSFPITDVTYKA